MRRRSGTTMAPHVEYPSGRTVSGSWRSSQLTLSRVPPPSSALNTRVSVIDLARICSHSRPKLSNSVSSCSSSCLLRAYSCSVLLPTTRERTRLSWADRTAKARISMSALASNSATRERTSSSSAASHWYFKKRERTSAAYGSSETIFSKSPSASLGVVPIPPAPTAATAVELPPAFVSAKLGIFFGGVLGRVGGVPRALLLEACAPIWGSP
mmetsp:Transcript_43281/g.106865  ORF Transcript_43281/g.106865 Transcript_43281/m.106865 type:complete len:212 (+) Transcript_43281:3901-4536(+)